MRIYQMAVIGACLAMGAPAFAQQSEFQQSIHDDLNNYQKDIAKDCGSTDKLTIDWVGKLANAPRDPEQKGWHTVTELGTSAVHALWTSCSNKAVAKAMSKMTAIVVTRGTGDPTFKFDGSKVTLTIDPSNTKDTPTQHAALVDQIKKQLDQ
jgi:hypothetical protein